MNKLTFALCALMGFMIACADEDTTVDLDEIEDESYLTQVLGVVASTTALPYCDVANIGWHAKNYQFNEGPPAWPLMYTAGEGSQKCSSDALLNGLSSTTTTTEWKVWTASFEGLHKEYTPGPPASDKLYDGTVPELALALQPALAALRPGISGFNMNTVFRYLPQSGPPEVDDRSAGAEQYASTTNSSNDIIVTVGDFSTGTGLRFRNAILEAGGSGADAPISVTYSHPCGANALDIITQDGQGNPIDPPVVVTREIAGGNQCWDIFIFAPDLATPIPERFPRPERWTDVPVLSRDIRQTPLYVDILSRVVEAYGVDRLNPAWSMLPDTVPDGFTLGFPTGAENFPWANWVVSDAIYEGNRSIVQDWGLKSPSILNGERQRDDIPVRRYVDGGWPASGTNDRSGVAIDQADAPGIYLTSEPGPYDLLRAGDRHALQYLHGYSENGPRFTDFTMPSCGETGVFLPCTAGTAARRARRMLNETIPRVLRPRVLIREAP